MKDYLVIGGSSGIGFDISKVLAEAGNRIAVVSSSSEKLQIAMSSLPGSGHMAIPYDLDDVANVNRIFEQLESAGVRLDGMAYCAGVAPLQLLRDNDYRLAEKVYRINVLSYIECVRLFSDARYSREESKIVAIASVAAHASGYRQTLYGSSKAALVAATKLMAKELLERKIHINCISPASTETPMLYSLYEDSDNMYEAVKRIQPLGVIPPEMIAKAAVFLFSTAADFLTGTELVYDAGFYL